MAHPTEHHKAEWPALPERSDFFRVDSPTRTVWLDVTRITHIETWKPEGRPLGLCDWVAAIVYVAGGDANGIVLEQEQMVALRRRFPWLDDA